MSVWFFLLGVGSRWHLNCRFSRLKRVSYRAGLEEGKGNTPLVLLICDLGGRTPVNAANRPAGAVGVDRDGGCLVVERRLDSLPQLERVAVEIDEVEVVVGSSGDEQRAGGVHGVDALGQL